MRKTLVVVGDNVAAAAAASSRVIRSIHTKEVRRPSAGIYKYPVRASWFSRVVVNAAVCPPRMHTYVTKNLLSFAPAVDARTCLACRCSAEATLHWGDYEMIDWERVVSGELRASSYCVRKVRLRRSAREASFVAEIPEGYTTRRRLWLSVRVLAWLLREGERRSVDKATATIVPSAFLPASFCLCVRLHYHCRASSMCGFRLGVAEPRCCLPPPPSVASPLHGFPTLTPLHVCFFADAAT